MGLTNSRKALSNAALKVPGTGVITDDPNRIASVLEEKLTLSKAETTDHTTLHKPATKSETQCVEISTMTILEVLTRSRNDSTPGPDHTLLF
jgi:hypothetical protein